MAELTDRDSSDEDSIEASVNNLSGNQLKTARTVTTRSTAGRKYVNIGQGCMRTTEEEGSDSDVEPVLPGKRQRGKEASSRLPLNSAFGDRMTWRQN
ncbi:hypothetical protein PoB_000347300 [Plakobranchus ocellatus]|uniref:Uncharacterized protein n=1 Tax=Plakobranchus ocellatus TaxID=259542 RepID=A0AAV3Y319_9GAST|nr:hypothetical protein PoB_000347300 [Plakobranchus ocellatus]